MSATSVDRAGGSGERWRDPRLLLWPVALIVPLLPVRMQVLDDGAPAWLWFMTPIVVFGLFPIVDTIAGLDKRNPPESETGRLESVRWYRWVTYAYIPLQYASLVMACAMWASGDLAWWQSLGLATSVGLVGGIAINTAHELGHKRPALERWLSKVALAQTAYGHFQLEHNRGHHAKVSTPDGSGQRPARRALLRVPAPHRRRAACARPCGSSASARRGWASGSGTPATSCSTRGR